MIIKIEGDCQYKDCTKKATHLASGRNSGIKCFCEGHATVIADERDPEYITHCPNCGCMFGVN